MQAAVAGIFRVVLIVAIHGDDTKAIGPILQKPAEGVFEGSTLALVHFVVQQGDFRVFFSQLGEVMQVLLLAAVVDQNNVGKAVFQQAVNHGYQLFIRVKRGQNHRNLG